jgi:hypothetical protein
MPHISFLAKVVNYFNGVEGYQALCALHLDVVKHIIELRAERLGWTSSTGPTIADPI